MRNHIQTLFYRTPKYLLPIFLHLLRDDSPEVRLNVISKLDELNEGKIIQDIVLQLLIILASGGSGVLVTIFVASHYGTFGR